MCFVVRGCSMACAALRAAFGAKMTTNESERTALFVATAARPLMNQNELRCLLRPRLDCFWSTDELHRCTGGNKLS